MYNYDDKMAEYAVKLVFSVAHKLQREYNFPNEVFEEHVSVGLIGAAKALQRFDPNKGYKFSTFACRCIKNEIYMLYRKQQVNVVSSLDETHDEDDKMTISNMYYSPMDDIEKKVMYMDILNIIDNDKEKIFSKNELLVYNIKRYNPEFKQREIAEIIGFTRSYVSRILHNMACKMYRHLRSYGYDNIFG